ncbi:P34 thiol protease [Spatholobus suberectus]|nr:P34 thiol protease [Spatholobus suberectus]
MGIYDGPNCPVNSRLVNHAMLIVGCGSRDGVGFWIVKNSWSSTWEMNGYAWVKRKTKPYGVCAINSGLIAQLNVVEDHRT